MEDRLPILRFDQVTARFDDRAVLDNVTLTAEPGESKVIYGAAGSGKHIMNLDEEQLFPLRRGVGILFQEGGLFDSLSVEENVSYPLLYQRDQELARSEVTGRVKEALNFVGLADTMDKYPSELSGGMRRRVGIARAAVTKPPLMLYDSPTAGLDPITAFPHHVTGSSPARQPKYDFVRNYTPSSGGKLLANYRFDPASGKIIHSRDKRRNTRFVVFRDGRIVFEGCESELLASTDRYVSKFSGRRASLANSEHDLPEHMTGHKSLVRL